MHMAAHAILPKSVLKVFTLDVRLKSLLRLFHSLAPLYEYEFKPYVELEHLGCTRL